MHNTGEQGTVEWRHSIKWAANGKQESLRWLDERQKRGNECGQDEREKISLHAPEAKYTV